MIVIRFWRNLRARRVARLNVRASGIKGSDQPQSRHFAVTLGVWEPGLLRGISSPGCSILGPLVYFAWSGDKR